MVVLGYGVSLSLRVCARPGMCVCVLVPTYSLRRIHGAQAQWVWRAPANKPIHPSIHPSIRPYIKRRRRRREPMTRAVSFTRSSICLFDGSNSQGPSIVSSVRTARPWNRSCVSDVVRQRGQKVWWCGAVGERFVVMDEATDDDDDDDNCDPMWGGRCSVTLGRST